MTAELILIRHAAVSERYQGRCYGKSDIELSVAGEQHSNELSEQLATWPITRVVHSGLRRTQYLAERLAAELGLRADCCEAIQERNFGNWELEHWDILHQRFSDEMMRVVSDPETFRPGGGETTYEMRDRVLEWFRGLPAEGLTVAVTHGGPIAAIRGTRRGAPVADWLSLIPKFGEVVRVSGQISSTTPHPNPLPGVPGRWVTRIDIEQ